MKKLYQLLMLAVVLLATQNQLQANCTNQYTSIDTTICWGQIVTVNGHNYNDAGTYIDTINVNSAVTCDSIITTNIIVTSPVVPSVAVAVNMVDITSPYEQPGAFTNNTYNNDNQAKYAFDHDTVNYGWGANNGGLNDYLGYVYQIPVVLNSYGLYLSCSQLGGWCSIDYSPINWTFEASHGGNAWVTLDSVANDTLQIGTLYNFNFTNTTAYKKYRINITKTADNGNYPHITEFYLAGADSLTPGPDTTITTDSHYGTNYAADAFDNDTITKGWASSGDSLPSWLAYQFPTPQVVNGYSIYNSCNQEGGWCDEGYTPKSWLFQGTNDNGVTWATLDSVTDGHLLIGIKSIYFINNTTAYKKYRIYITHTDYGSYARITEMELLQNQDVCTTNSYLAAVTSGGTSPVLQWKVNGANAGTGSNPQTFTGLHNGDVVTCVLIPSNWCQTTDTSTSNSLTYTCVSGINDIENNVVVSLFPNPNNGNFTVQFSDNEVHQLVIYNALGSLVAKFEKAASQKQVDISALPAGVYFLSVSVQNQKQQLRFVVSK
jgi:hypothetical protein